VLSNPPQLAIPTFFHFAPMSPTADVDDAQFTDARYSHFTQIEAPRALIVCQLCCRGCHPTDRERCKCCCRKHNLVLDILDCVYYPCRSFVTVLCTTLSPLLPLGTHSRLCVYPLAGTTRQVLNELQGVSSRDDLANKNPSQAMCVPFIDVRDWTLLSWCPWAGTTRDVPLCRLIDHAIITPMLSLNFDLSYAILWCVLYMMYIIYS